MDMREGLVPTVLGTVVTTSGLVLRKFIPSNIAWGIVGFGLAHVVLGTIDLFEHDDEYSIIELYEEE
ncbi:hypothetical protein CLPU_1c03390 [Gottschalkia purinilytica]|uniref:Asparagine synthase n=1 Tax=Gottschalkia purinilytica TaxID=1503 RepID=A0A0L0WFD0_GOTPU|nr:hypothetical protein [Gottschalkia purinilytica]KNF10174.1 hypothetical protein CLPU_1c03390 [Gottschalkia purinilytica]